VFRESEQHLTVLLGYDSARNILLRDQQRSSFHRHERINQRLGVVVFGDGAQEDGHGASLRIVRSAAGWQLGNGKG
jgi:hypothetical protein